MANEYSDHYYSGQGDFLVAERTPTGTPKGLMWVGNVPEASISIETTKFEHKESRSGQRAVDLTIIQEKKGTFEMTAENLRLSILAMGLWGTVSDAAETIVAEEEVTAYLDYVCPLNHPNIKGTPAVVVMDETDVTTYVVDVDYTVDYVNGTITPLSTGSISELDVLHVAYTYQAYQNLDAFTETSMERWVRFQGLNTVEGGGSVVVDIFKGSFDPLTDYNLINNDEIGSINMAGNALYDTLQPGNSKFFRQRNFVPA